MLYSAAVEPGQRGWLGAEYPGERAAAIGSCPGPARSDSRGEESSGPQVGGAPVRSWAHKSVTASGPYSIPF